MKQFIFLFLFSICLHSQKYVDLTSQLANVTHGMVINGNDFSVTEQVIITTNEINFKKPAYLRFYNVLLNVNGGIKGQGKINLLENSRMYLKDRNDSDPVSKLYSSKPFGEELLLSKAKLFKKEKKGAPYTLWYTNGKKFKTGIVGDDTKIRRMFYNVKIGKKYLDKQLLSN